MHRCRRVTCLEPLGGQRAVLVEAVELAVRVQGVAHPPEQRQQLLLQIVVLRVS